MRCPGPARASRRAPRHQTFMDLPVGHFGVSLLGLGPRESRGRVVGASGHVATPCEQKLCLRALSVAFILEFCQ